MNTNKNQETCQTVPLFAVYVLWCRKTNMHYVGVTSRKVEKRIREHKRDKKQFLHKEIQRIGWEDNFDYWVVEENIPSELINEREQFWVKFFDCVYLKGYNKTCGGISNLTVSNDTREILRQKALERDVSGERNPHYGKKHTEKALAKMRGKKRDEKARANMSKARKGKPGPRKGKKHTTEAKEKNRQAHLGKTPWNKGLKCPPHTDEHKAKIAAALIGEKNPNYGKPSPFKGIPRSEETKRKIGKGNSGKHRTEEMKANLREKALAREAAKRAAKAVAEENLAAAHSTPTNLSNLLDAVILQKGLSSEIAFA